MFIYKIKPLRKN